MIKSKPKDKVKQKHFDFPPYLSLITEKQTLVKSFLLKFEKYILNNLLLSRNDKIIVAVSGGVDSVCLLDAFCQLKDKFEFKIYVTHFNHSIRDNADKDEEFVNNLADHYDLPYYAGKGDVLHYAKENSLSVEHAARQLRYSFFDKLGNSLNINLIATAHTLNDSAETVLLNLFRGSGLTGLSGIKSRRPLSRKNLLIRPFLEFKKSELIEYAECRKLVWHEDETNAQLQYHRNIIRNVIIPEIVKSINPSAIDTINRSASILQGAEEFISDHIENSLNYVVYDKKKKQVSMKISWLRSFSFFMQGELLHKLITTYFSIQFPSLAVIEKALSLIDKETGSTSEISKSVFALKDRDYLIIYKKIKQVTVNKTIDTEGEFMFDSFKLILTKVKKKDVVYNANSAVEYLDFDTLEEPLTVRNWHSGDSFQPLGNEGTVKVSDFLINSKVSMIDKGDCYVLTAGDSIVWVIGRRISEIHKVSSTTKTILKAEVILDLQEAI